MLKAKRIKLANQSEKFKEQLSAHNEKNYLNVILQNYLLYNSKARTDIAELLYWKYKETVKTRPNELASQFNLVVEIYSKLFQISEDLALVGLLLLKLNPVVKTYMESNNSNIMDFYERAYKGFSKK